MCTRGSPDIYTLSPRALGVYIRQTTRAHGITIKNITSYVGLLLLEEGFPKILYPNKQILITNMIITTCQGLAGSYIVLVVQSNCGF